MPGPQSKSRLKGKDTGTSNKRAARRIAARQAAWSPTLQGYAARKPGSENRKK